MELIKVWIDTLEDVVLTKISKNLNVPRNSFVLRTCAATCLLLYRSTINQPIGVFISTCMFRALVVSLTPFSWGVCYYRIGGR
jgi:hypothetical protein